MYMVDHCSQGCGIIGNAYLHEPDKLIYCTFVCVESVLPNGTFPYEAIFPVKCVIIFPQTYLQLASMFTNATVCSSHYHCSLSFADFISSVRKILDL